jgi:alpha-L-fucosidase 2
LIKLNDVNAIGRIGSPAVAFIKKKFMNSGILKLLMFIAILVQDTVGKSQNIELLAAKKGFTSWIPAATTDDALLSGNGAMGVMVYGRPYDEVIIVNHALSLLPVEIPSKLIDQASRLAEIRKLLADGKYAEVARFLLTKV